MSPESLYCAYLYCKGLVDAALDESATPRIRELRVDGVMRAHASALYYYKKGFPSSIVDGMLEKKNNFVLKAKTQQEINQIMVPTLPRWDAGKVACDGPYYIPEEEAMLWRNMTLVAPLYPEASEHLSEVYQELGHIFDPKAKRDGKNHQP